MVFVHDVGERASRAGRKDPRTAELVGAAGEQARALAGREDLGPAAVARAHAALTACG